MSDYTQAFDRRIAGLVNAERMETYGHPADHFKKAAQIKRILRSGYKGDETLLHAMEMIADKLVRLSNSPTHFDSWLDIAGYARTGCMVLDVRASETPFTDAAVRQNERLRDDE